MNLEPLRFQLILTLILLRVSPLICSEESTPTTPISQQGQDGSRTLFELDLNAKKTTNEYQYLKCRTYTPKAGFAFNKVKHGDSTDIWKASGDLDYVTKVEVINDIKTTLTLGDKSTKVYEKKGDKWEEIIQYEKEKKVKEGSQAENRPQMEELDLKKKESTDQFCYLKTRTYTAFKGYGFNKVYQKKRVGSDKVLWLAEKESEYGIKVVVVGDIKTTLTLGDKSTKSYELTSSGCCGNTKTWNEVGTATAPSTEHGTRGGAQSGQVNKEVDNKEKEKSKDSKSGAKEEEKTLIELNVDNKKGTDQYDYSKSGNTHTWTAKDNFRFKSVKKGGTVVWSAATDKSTNKVVLATNTEGKPTIKVGDDNSTVWTQY